MPIRSDYYKHGDKYYYPKERIVPDGKILGYLPPNRLINPPRFFDNGANIPDARVLYVERVVFGGRVVLTDRLQNLIFHDNFERAYGMPFELADDWDKAHGINEFVHMLEEDLAYCNEAGSEHRKVPLANLNMKADWPLWNEITMPSIVEMVSDKPVKRGVLKEPMYEYYVINAQSPDLEKYNSTDFPYRWHRPNNIIWAHYNGSTFVPEGNEPFWRFKNKVKMPNLVNYTDRAFAYPHQIRILYPGDVIPNTMFTKDG